MFTVLYCQVVYCLILLAHCPVPCPATDTLLTQIPSLYSFTFNLSLTSFQEMKDYNVRFQIWQTFFIQCNNDYQTLENVKFEANKKMKKWKQRTIPLLWPTTSVYVWLKHTEREVSLPESIVASTALLRKMASDIAREESFRTSLRNQRRRLSATEGRPSIPDIESYSEHPLFFMRAEFRVIGEGYNLK